MSLSTKVEQCRNRGSHLLGRGLFVAARAELARWLALVEHTGDPGQIIPPLNALAAVEYSRAEADRAIAYLQRALNLVDDRAASDVDKLRVYLNLMTLHTQTGRLDEALGWAERAAALQSAGDAAHVHGYWLNLSVLYWRRQEWVPMRHASRKAFDRSMIAGDVVAAAKALTNLGIAHLEVGAYRLAERDLTRALRLYEQAHSWELAYAHAELGRLHSLKGDYQAALAAGQKALDNLLADVAGLDKEEVARVSRLFGRIFSTSGHRNLTLKYLNRAAAYFSQLGLRAEWQRSTELIGQVLSEPVRPVKRQWSEEVQRLDFLTAVLDLTDDLESVDPYLRGHSERVASLAVLVGESVGLGGEDLVILNHAARLHDVGMVAVDAELLQREGLLTEAERRRLGMHSEIGEEMLRPYGLPLAGLKAIRHHHEHYDGTGTPDGLRRDEIPLLARIVALGDVYDALTSERVYRSAMEHDEALGQMKLMAGNELDPGLMQRFFELFEI